MIQKFESDEIVILDDFLNQDLFDKAKKRIDSHLQEYFLHHNISLEDEGDPRLFYGFGCNFVEQKKPNIYQNRYNTEVIRTINEKIKERFGFKKVVRSRLDMTTYRGKEQVVFGPHIDVNGIHYTTIFYFNTCNAPTIMYENKLYRGSVDENCELVEKQRILPKENRLMLFQGNHIHTGTNATDISRRILLNSNFIF